MWVFAREGVRLLLLLGQEKGVLGVGVRGVVWTRVGGVSPVGINVSITCVYHL